MSVRLPCPVDGCDWTRAPWQEVCHACWTGVPRALRDEVVANRGTWEFDENDRYWIARSALIEVAEDRLAYGLG